MIDNNEIKSKSKKMFGLIIGIFSLIVVIVGAAFAYFGAGTITNFNTSTLTYETGDNYIVTLNGTSAVLTFGTITKTDMEKKDNNLIYYASATGKTTTQTEEIIGVTHVTEEDYNKYSCHFTLSLSHSGTADIIDKFLSENYTNRSANQLIITINGEEYDLNDGFPSTITGTVITDNNVPGVIKAGMKFINLSKVDQKYLKNSDGHINIDVTGFTCDIIGRAQIAYWTYEGGDFTTSENAKNKVDDYRKLKIDKGALLNYSVPYDFYSTLSDCTTALDGVSSSYENKRCELLSTDDYILMMSISVDDESICESAGFSCTFNQSTGKWEGSSPEIIPQDDYDFCGKRVEALNYYFAAQSQPMSAHCVHPQEESYYILYDDEMRQDSLHDCELLLDYFTNSTAEEFFSNPSIMDYYEVGLMGQNIYCEPEYQQKNVFVKEMTKYSVASATNNIWKIFYYNFFKNDIYYHGLDSCNYYPNHSTSASHNLIMADYDCVPATNYTTEILDTELSSTTYNTKSDCITALIGMYLNSSNSIDSKICGYNSSIEKYQIYNTVSYPTSVEDCQAQTNALIDGENIPEENIGNVCRSTNYAMEVHLNDNSQIWQSWDTEAECLMYVNSVSSVGNMQGVCKLDPDLGKYILYLHTNDTYTLNDCNEYLSQLLSLSGNTIKASCVQEYKTKALALDNNYEDEDSCLDNIRDDNEFCEPQYENGETIRLEKNEICGIVEDNLLCYEPENINDVSTIVGTFRNDMTCQTTNGDTICNSEHLYADIIRNGLIQNGYNYNSMMIDKRNANSCGYQFGNLSCSINYKAGIVIESEHEPYPNSINNTYYENTFDEASSITIELTYQTEGTNWDWIYLYENENTIYNDQKYGGSTKTTETITIQGNYIKIVFRTDGSGNNYYGFKAVITPNY